MKRFLIGFLVGSMLFSCIGAFAVSYVANQAGFKVLVNGEEFVSDPPALEVEGRTYLPLRAMGEALGIPVIWNAELGQAEVGTTPQSFEGNYSRQNPAPIGTPQWITVDNYLNKYTAGVKVVEVIRGEDANKRIREKNAFNPDPDDGYEYILAKVSVTIEKSEDGKAVTVNQYSFDCFSDNNEKYAEKSIVVPDALNTQLFEGGSATGYILLHVKKGDKPKIVYGMDYDGTKGIWFALQ